MEHLAVGVEALDGARNSPRRRAGTPRIGDPGAADEGLCKGRAMPPVALGAG
jgi:hypothetical protein